MPGRLISRTPPFEGGHVGANPAPAAILNAEFGLRIGGRRLHSAFRAPKSAFRTLGGEIASRLAYTQKSEGQNLPERPLKCGIRIGDCGSADRRLHSELRSPHLNASWCNQERVGL